MVVVGEKEEKDNSLSLRRRFIAKQITFSVDNFILDIQKEIMNRSLPNRES
jgi:threonyl-tRNA synthetase